MGRGKGSGPGRPPADDSGESEPTAEQNATESAEWDRGEGLSFLEQLPAQEITITIEKQNEASREWEWCAGPGPASSASIEEIRDAFGPGRYRAIARDAAKKHVIARRTFSIAGKPNPKGSSWIGASARAEQPAASPDPAAGRMAQLMDALIARALEPPPPPPSLLEQAAKLGAALGGMAPLIERLIPARKDPVALAKEIAEIGKPSGGSGDGAVDLFLRGMEMAQTMKRGGVPVVRDDRNSLGAVMRDFLPGFLEVMRNAQKGSPDFVHNPSATAAAPAPGQLPAGQPPAAEQPMTVYEALRSEIPQLVLWAREGRDPAIVADALLLKVPPYGMSVVEHETTQPQWRTRWFEMYPELEPFRLWVLQVLDAAADSFAADDGDDGEVEPND